MNNVILFKTCPENVAPKLDGEVLAECTKQAIEEFGEYEFAMTFVERREQFAIAA